MYNNGLMDATQILTRYDQAVGSLGITANWTAYTRSQGNAFIVDHPVNGDIGSPQLGVNGSQLTLGSGGLGAYAAQYSGGTF